VIAVIVFIAMITAVGVVYQWGKSSNSAVVSNANRSAAQNVPVSMPAATPIVTLPRATTATATPPTASQVSVVPSASVPALTKTFGREERFVTVISPVSIRRSSGKTVSIQSGAHFRLMAIERDQAIIRYYDGRNYSIPISATNYR
jgi:hypothetical protein